MSNLALKEIQITEAVRLANEIVKTKSMIDTVKPLYGRLEELTLQLKELIGTEAGVDIAEQVFMFGEKAMFTAAQTVSIVDNFAAKNTVFRPAAVKRYEVKCDPKAVEVASATK